eukprot:5403644-Karenia_brevis.AAC.1
MYRGSANWVAPAWVLEYDNMLRDLGLACLFTSPYDAALLHRSNTVPLEFERRRGRELSVQLPSLKAQVVQGVTETGAVE